MLPHTAPCCNHVHVLCYSMLSLAMLCGVVVCGGCGCGCFASAVVHSVKGVSGAQLQNKTKKKKKKKEKKKKRKRRKEERIIVRGF